MIRNASKRFSALFAAVLFLLSSAGEGFGIQPCPFHDADYGASSGEHSDAGHDEHAGHDAHHHGAPTPEPDAAPGHDHHGESGLCTHVDVCQSAAGVHLPADLDAFEFAAFAVESPSILPPVERLFAAFIPFFLPYPNAPPAHG